MPVYASKPIILKEQDEITLAVFDVEQDGKEISLNEINIDAGNYKINVLPQLEKTGKHSNRLKLMRNNTALDTVQIFTDKDYKFNELKNNAHINRSTNEENVNRLICFAVVCKDEIDKLISSNLSNAAGKDNEELNKYKEKCSDSAKIIFKMKKAVGGNATKI